MFYWLQKLMVQVVPTGYDYIGGSRNCLKEAEGGGVVQPFMITFIHHSVRKGGIIALKITLSW